MATQRQRRISESLVLTRVLIRDGRKSYGRLLFSTRRSRAFGSNLPPLNLRQQSRHAIARLMRRTRGKSFPHREQRYKNRRVLFFTGKGSVWHRASSAMARSWQALRHSAPCGETRRRPARNCASKWASSWRRVRSISAASCSRRRGFNEIRLRRESARPAALNKRAFHST